MRGPRQDWLDIVRKNGSEGFSKAFAENVAHDSSVMNGSCVGVDVVGAFFAATSGMYDRVAFTHETVDRAKTYLEWEGQAFDMDVAGSTILTRGGSGLIQSIRLYLRPLHLVIRFSAELERRLNGRVDPAPYVRFDWISGARSSISRPQLGVDHVHIEGDDIDTGANRRCDLRISGRRPRKETLGPI